MFEIGFDSQDLLLEATINQLSKVSDTAADAHLNELTVSAKPIACKRVTHLYMREIPVASAVNVTIIPISKTRKRFSNDNKLAKSN